ncbi:MAG: tetratricopeptide repeat protein [Pseudomonadota bacterium]|nr:tetratricopeptide repeat protein [Pseudomonadota bacterium]
MAERDPEQDNLFKEIDEDLRQEHYAKLWKKYGTIVIAVAVLLVAGVAGQQAWNAYSINQRSESSIHLTSALRAAAEGKTSEAERLLVKLADEGSSGYALLARFNQAALLARSENGAAAADAYLKISLDTEVDTLFRGLATVLSVLHDLDTGDAGQLTARLTPFLDTSNPWRHSAKELTALLARKSGDLKRARDIFRELTDDGSAPAGIRARAAEMSALLGG